MALLTLKSIARTGDVGTDAVNNAGKIFDRAFEQFSSASKGADTIVNNQFETQSNIQEQELLSKLQGYSDVNQFAADKVGLSEDINNSNLTDADRANLYAKLNSGTEDINARNTRTFEQSKTNAEQAAYGSDQEISAAIPNIKNRQEADALIQTINAGTSPNKGAQIDAVNAQVFKAQNNLTQQQTFDTNQFIRGIDGEGIAIEPGNSESTTIKNVLNSVEKIDGYLQGVPFTESAALRTELLQNANITPSVMIQSAFQALASDPTNIPDDIAATLTAAVNSAYPGLVTDKQISTFIADKEEATDVKTAKANAADIRKRNLDAQYALQAQVDKASSAEERSLVIQKNVNALISDHWYDWIGPNDKEEATALVTDAVNNGVPLSDALRILAAQANSSWGGNLNKGGLKQMLNVEKAEAFKKSLTK